jgi:hypothetical protein
LIRLVPAVAEYLDMNAGAFIGLNSENYICDLLGYIHTNKRNDGQSKPAYTTDIVAADPTVRSTKCGQFIY